jgi:cold shock CspA family protein
MRAHCNRMVDSKTPSKINTTTRPPVNRRSHQRIFSTMQFDPSLDRHLRGLFNDQPQRRPISKKEEVQMYYFGTVSHWNDPRGYGFLTSDGSIDGVPDRDLFVHAKRLPKGVKTIAPGQRVEFTTVTARTPGKPVEAKVLRIINEMAEAA